MTIKTKPERFIIKGMLTTDTTKRHAVFYYHQASFANLTSFANFVAAASNLEIIPKFKL